MTPNEIKKSMSYLHKIGVTPLLIGDRGVGKSEVVKQFAKEYGFESVVDIRLGQMADAGDLVGLASFEKDKDGNDISTKYMTPGYLPKEGKHVIFLDEINRAPKDVLQAVFELVWDGKISVNGYEVPKDSIVVAAMNPDTEGYSVNSFDDEAFYDRFCFIRFDPTMRDWLDYAKTQQVNPHLLSFIKEQPKMLSIELEKFSINDYAKPSRRSWFQINKLLSVCNDQTILKQLMIGLVGTEAAIAFHTSISDVNKKVDPKVVLDDFRSVKDLISVYSNDETNRQDILKDLVDSLYDHVLEVRELNDTQCDNLKDFIFTLPKDLSFSFARKLAVDRTFFKDDDDNKINTRFRNDKEVIKYFEELLKTEVKTDEV